MIEKGEVQAAYVAARELLERSLAAGEDAYPNAGYAIAWAHYKLGQALQLGNASEAALPHLEEARRRFQNLADAGDARAAHMASAAINESGNCLLNLGRLDEAATAYEEAVKRFEALGDKRWMAVSKGQLGTLRIRQERYSEALESHEEARRTFESLGEPNMVAVAWHQIGSVHRNAGQLEQSERAYRQALAISVQQSDLGGESSCLGELGSLYSLWGRLEESVKCFRQAADIYVRLKDLSREGLVRNNMALTLFNMQRYDEARDELLRAIECREPYGHAAELWKSWNILEELEKASGNAERAGQARQRAVESYLSYRRAGGQNVSGGAQLCARAAEAIARGDTTELERQLAEFLRAQIPPPIRVLISKVQAILSGERNPALADDPDLDYDAAVELQLLLEVLGAR